MGPDAALDPLGSTKVHNPCFKAYLERKSSDGEILPHDVLLEMGRGGLKAYLNDENDESEQLLQVRRIWQDLLTTTKSTAVTDQHLTSACNALCVFLECVCSSGLPSVKSFGLCKGTWLDCFRVILDSYGEGKAKPMRQVLITLADTLRHHPDHALSSSILNEIMSEMVRVVFIGDTGHLKASLVILELFIRKVASFEQVLVSIIGCLMDNKLDWSRRIKLFGLESILDDGGALHVDSEVVDTDLEQRANSSFVVALLMALLSRESQSAAVTLFKSYSTALIGSGRGQYLYSLSTSKPAQNLAESGHDVRDSTRPCSWIPLVRGFLTVHHTAINAFSDFLFPLIFKIDPHGYDEYIKAIQETNSDTVNVLAVVRVATHIGLERDPATTLGRVFKVEYTPSQGASSIFGQLLSHGDADVRARTFALLVSSSSITAPFTLEVLQCLTNNMKYLYGDSDSRNRGEVLSVVRKFVNRLRGSSYALRRNMGISNAGSTAEEIDSSTAEQRSQESFVAWFLEFLHCELSPTASYQRHIMALKSIEIFLHSGIDSRVAEKHGPELGQDETKWPFHMSLHSLSLNSALLNLLLDPFEDVRATSSCLLKMTLSCACETLLGQSSYPWTSAARATQCLCFEHGTALTSAVLPVERAKKNISINSNETCPITVPSDLGSKMQDNVHNLARVADRLASNTNRADHADGAAKLYELCYTLARHTIENDVENLRFSKQELVEEIISPVTAAFASMGDDLNAPFQGFSLHGRLLSLRYILGHGDFSNHPDWKPMDGRIMAVCERVWDTVSNRLCIDSPENSTDEADEEFVGGPKDILSYSWRALRDSSLLLRALLDGRVFKEQSTSSPLKLYFLEKIGSLCMDQLSNLRHRGAFSTVAQTFSVLCQRIADSKDASITSLRNTWYENAIQTLDRQATKLTRRSAGLPAMIAGLLTSCPPAFFDDFLASFRSKAEDLNYFLGHVPDNDHEEIQLPQVHALNCLREIFTNAKFRVMTEPHVMAMLKIGASALSCDVWAIRNCGLMLFRACTSRLGKARITSLLDPQISQSWTNESEISIDRAPEVLQLAVGLLDPSCFTLGSREWTATFDYDPNHALYGDRRPQTVATERIFAALDLLGRLARLPEGGYGIDTLLLQQMDSKVWKVREQAARIFTTRVAPWNAMNAISQLVGHMSDHCSQNAIHGGLLCIRQILRKAWGAHGMALEVLQELVATEVSALSAIVEQDHVSPMVSAAFVDILNDIFEEQTILRSSGNLPTQSLSVLHNALDEYIHRVAPVRKNNPMVFKCRSFALHEFYEAFQTIHSTTAIENLLMTLQERFHSQCETDTDSAVSLIRRFVAQPCWSAIICQTLSGLYQFVVEKEYPDDVKVEAMIGLSVLIERKQLNSELGQGLIRISHILLVGRRRDGRDLWNARLRLQANLFAVASGNFSSADCAGKTCQLCSWTAMLHEAAVDEIDLPTRINAANSLFVITSKLLSDNAASTTPSHHLPIYMVLYDLLNDDDEDVRGIAASTTSVVLSATTTYSISLIELFPLAASEKLAHLLSERFRTDHCLVPSVLAKIWPSLLSPNQRLNSNWRIKRCSIKTLLERTQLDSDVLFEEERQNLYIDDIREIELWSGILKTINPPGQDHQVILEEYVLDGLKELKNYLGTVVGFDDPLGLTSQVDVFTLFTRVIHLAGVLICWSKAESISGNGSDSPIYEGDLLHELKALGEAGKRVRIHGRLIRSIKGVIDSI